MATHANPIVQAIIAGQAPPPARLAAARGILPLTQEEILESLVALIEDPEEEVRVTARATIERQDPGALVSLAQNVTTSPEVLHFLGRWNKATFELAEAVIINPSTPDHTILELAQRLRHGNLLEAITINHQRLIREPKLIEAILNNPARTPEAERLARQVKEEFFDKEYGSQFIAAEQEAREQRAREDAARVSDDDVIALNVDDFALRAFEEEFGPIDDEVVDLHLEFTRILTEVTEGGVELSEKQKSMIQKILAMNPRQRAKVALSGDREARTILSRDSNRSVCLAVIKNPRITDAEVETIAAMRTSQESMLRQISLSRNWMRSYPIVHNLVRNPKTPPAISMQLLNRLQTKDLKAVSSNKNVPEVVRRMALRSFTLRTTGKSA